MIIVRALFGSQVPSRSSRDRCVGLGLAAFAIVSGAPLSGCFKADEPLIQSTDSTTTSTESTSSTSSTTTATMSSTETMSSADGSTSTTEATSGADDSDGSSTGGVSNCPGGDPTPGEAPYILSTVLAEQDTDDVDVGDINGDGHLDLISLSRADGAVETFWGDGTGDFASDGVTMMDMAGYPDTVRLGAIADDTVDLFIHMEGPVELWVLRGDGAGNWPSPQVYETTYVRAIDIADFNGDNVLDLAYVGASNLEVRKGIELTESYEDPDLYGENYGSVLRAADITGDGKLDILTADYSSTELQVYSGLGDGTFEAEMTVVTGSSVTGIDTGDLDGDGHPDLVLTTEEDLRVFYGLDAGGISSTPATVIEDALYRVRVADIDADGVHDLITRSGASIEIRFAHGDATFSEPVPFACSASIRRLEVGDLNEDCVPDIVAALGPGEDVCVLISDRD
jgi:hypothetical protein